MADTLSGVVGLAGTNRREDVLKVQKALNNIPTAQGGQGMAGGRGKLAENGFCLVDKQTARYSEQNFMYDQTLLAICKFQMHHFKCISGQINPDSVTWATMQRLLGNANGGPQAFTVDWLSAVTTQGRAEIARKGLAEAAPDPVSDQGRAPGAPRKGGDILKNYFDKATRGAINWTARGKIKPMGKGDWIEITNLEGVMKSTYRIPQGESKPSGTSWCGIFATYILQQAGLPVYWQMGTGLCTRNQRLPVFTDLSLLSQGDVVVMKGDEVHHAIYLNDVGNKLHVVEGNTNNQRVIESTRWNRSDIAYFYCSMAGQDM
jgi:hypothetical protein